MLCPTLRAVTSGLCDLEVPLDELSNLPLSPERVLIVENLESGLALPDLPGCVAVLGLGNAVSVLSRLNWVSGKPIMYWGDIDTHGFMILDRARETLGALSSVLMDEATLLACRDLWVEEPVQASAQTLVHLTATERETFEGLRAQRWVTTFASSRSESRGLSCSRRCRPRCVDKPSACMYTCMHGYEDDLH